MCVGAGSRGLNGGLFTPGSFGINQNANSPSPAEAAATAPAVAAIQQKPQTAAAAAIGNVMLAAFEAMGIVVLVGGFIWFLAWQFAKGMFDKVD